MTLAIIRSRAACGIDAPPVTVEVHLSNGLPRFNIVGMPETAVRESRDRVRSAILTSNFEFPDRRITVNLAPADLPKEGGRFDLPVAIGILAASGQLKARALDGHEFYGELALDGGLRAVNGLVPALIGARAAGACVVLPRGNAREAGLVRHREVYDASHLLQVTAALDGVTPLTRVAPLAPVEASGVLDLRDVRGQHMAKRALQVSAAGGHNLLMVGPPGSGKTMLANRLPGLQPRLTEAQVLEVAAIRSVAGLPVDLSGAHSRPFRSPHHSCSAAALVGGGSRPRPGEVSLAHCGVLFLDELPEFSRHALEQLREPLEAGVVHISRAAQQAVYPARFQLLAAMNPCPCGYLGESRCRCAPERIQRYRDRISGPLLDRIDIHVEVPAVPLDRLRDEPAGAGSEELYRQVLAARERQRERQGCLNRELAIPGLARHCALAEAAQALLDRAMARLGLSARAYHRVIRLARSIADLEGAPQITECHIGEAVQLRCLDRPLSN